MTITDKRFAVVGHPVAHSLSPWIHQQFARQTGIALHYEKIDVLPEHFAGAISDFFAAKGCGLNITLPYKEKAFELADAHTLRCQQAGAANTLWMHQGRLHADNTDGFGLMTDLSRFVTVRDKRILILGAGGAVRGILPALHQAGAHLTVMNRTPARAKALKRDYAFVQCLLWADSASAFDVIINGTSAAMRAESMLIPEGIIHAGSFCYDLSYAQKGQTAFVSWAQQRGLAGADGLGMLVFQAAEAFAVWHGQRPDAGSILHQLRARQKSL